MESRCITLVICDDHRVLTDALASVIAPDEELQLVAAPLDTAEEAVTACAEHNPDVVLMDIELAGAMDGIEATRRIKALSPKTKVVILSGSRRRNVLAEAVEAGASGFLDKSEAVADVLGVIRAAAAGELLVDPQRLPQLLSDLHAERAQHREQRQALDRLTPREREVLRCLGEGKRTDAMAEDLHISPQTAQTHVQRILTKLGVHSKLEAVALAARASEP